MLDSINSVSLVPLGKKGTLSNTSDSVLCYGGLNNDTFAKNREVNNSINFTGLLPAKFSQMLQKLFKGTKRGIAEFNRPDVIGELTPKNLSLAKTIREILATKPETKVVLKIKNTTIELSKITQEQEVEPWSDTLLQQTLIKHRGKSLEILKQFTESLGYKLTSIY